MGRRQVAPLVGPSVRLEPLSLEHVDALVAAASEDRSSYRWTMVPDGVDATRTYVEEALADARAVPFVHVRLADGAVVGCTRFMEVLPWGAEIGATWLAASAQRSAINTEAKLLMLSLAFDGWGLERVSFQTDARNERSRRAIERLGARFDGVRRLDRLGVDGPRDSAWYSIVRPEWPAVEARLRDRAAGHVTGGQVPDHDSHWFEALADHMGPAYLRYSFTYGTEQEVAFLVEALGLEPGMRVLDVGCGPGRHAHALARRGIEVVGVDISQRFVDLAAAAGVPGATFVRADARRLAYDAEFDAALSLCQGAFGLQGTTGEDGVVLERIAAALRPGGRVAMSAFSAWFQARHLEDADTFDAATGVNHERTEVRDAEGRPQPADLWTTCFTPKELRLLAERAGLVVEHVWAVTPGSYARRPPDLEHPEHLLVARR